MRCGGPAGAPARCVLGKGGRRRSGLDAEGRARAEGLLEGGGRREGKGERALGITVSRLRGQGMGCVVLQALTGEGWQI